MNPDAIEHNSASLPQRKLIEPVCDQFDQAWQAGQSPRFETYLEEVEESVQSVLFKELVKIEHEYRAKAGKPLSADEVRERSPPQFSHLVDPLMQEFQTAVNHGTAASQKPRPPSLVPGERIGKFEINEELGRGNFGTVYRAWDHGLDREVAIKVSKLDLESDEGRIIAKLKHPNIVTIHYQQLLHERNLHLICMEYVPGDTLRSLIRKVPVEQVCEIGAKLAKALDYAHLKDVLHCDVKPANVILDKANPKLVDFNVAMRTDLEFTGIGGTFAYMSLEQLDAYNQTNEEERKSKAEKVNGRSDIYSLAIVLWELVTGNSPFADTPDHGDRTATLTAMIQQRKAGPSERALAQLSADIPPGLGQVLLRCLKPDPHDRYASAAEFAHELELCAVAELQDLLYPPKKSWRELALRWPLILVVVLGVLCNGLLSFLNIIYNEAILDRNSLRFWVLVLFINSVGFSVAILINAYLAWPVLQAIASLRAGVPHSPIEPVVTRCLKFGHFAAVVAFASWAAASVVWAGFMWGELGSTKALHFAGSLLEFGTIAAVLTFFSVTFAWVRVVLPFLVRETRARISTSLETLLQVYFGLSVCVPIGTLIVFAVAMERPARHLIIWLAVLIAAGFGVGLACSHHIRADLRLLSRYNVASNSKST